MKFICFVLVCGLGLFVFDPVIPVSAQVPARDKIVFVSNRDGNSEIYIMNSDSSGQLNLTQHRENDYSPVWSPTGKQILFASERAGKVSDLYVMDADGADWFDPAFALPVSPQSHLLTTIWGRVKVRE